MLEEWVVSVAKQWWKVLERSLTWEDDAEKEGIDDKLGSELREENDLDDNENENDLDDNDINDDEESEERCLDWVWSEESNGCFFDWQGKTHGRNPIFPYVEEEEIIKQFK